MLPRMYTLADCVMIAERTSRLSLCSMLTRSHRGVRFALCADCALYDEASMELKADGGSSAPKSFSCGRSSDALRGEVRAIVSAFAPWSLTYVSRL